MITPTALAALATPTSAELALDRPFLGLDRSMATPQCSSPVLDVPRAVVP